ncbi:MAG: prolipoprotein diacylglyceryl transferase [Anaerolineae bacterium]|nr:prolipoprotein diacylglyceryl transferase [Anaerolineae bacterium]
MLGIVLSIGWMLLRARAGKRSATLDACLLALGGGILLGRVGHVMLNWAYFRDHTDEIIRIYWQGGLSVPGVVMGAYLGLWIAARWRKLDFVHLLDSATLVLPLLALMGWWGCAANACAYGAPVEHMTDYPPLLTWVQPDIYGIVEPRFAIQRMGIVLSAILLSITVMIFWQGWLVGKRFPLMLILVLITYTLLDIGELNYDSFPASISAEGGLSLAISLILGLLLVRNSFPQTKN